jgi:hypothetical protein
MKTAGREAAPFVLPVRSAEGKEERILARAVIDASGTYETPNPLGAGGVPALGEQGAVSHLFYGIPDVLGTERARYERRRVLVVGAGHSALNALLDLAELARQAPATHITWAVRRARNDPRLYGGRRQGRAARPGRAGDSRAAPGGSGRGAAPPGLRGRGPPHLARGRQRVFVENTASRALLRSVGFREVGIYERHARLDEVMDAHLSYRSVLHPTECVEDQFLQVENGIHLLRGIIP